MRRVKDEASQDYILLFPSMEPVSEHKRIDEKARFPLSGSGFNFWWFYI